MLNNLVLILPASSPKSITPTRAAHHFSLVAILLLATAVPHEYPVPGCTFSAGHLGVTLILGRGIQVVFLHSTSIFLACLSPFHFAITSCISSISSYFLVTASGSNLPIHKGHSPPIMLLGRHSSPRHGHAT